MRMTGRTMLAAMIVSALGAGATLPRSAGGDWLHANGSWDCTRFGTLNRIGGSDIGDLRIKRVYPVGGELNAQTVPVEHDGVPNV